MLRIIGMLLMLWGFGWLISEIPSTPNPSQANAVLWRRTCTGWERADRLLADLKPREPVVHPVTVAAGLLFLALLGSIGLEPDTVGQRDTANLPRRGC